MDDAELVRRLQAGDSSGWAEVYDRYADRLHDYCASILHDRHEAEDALHDAFVTASQRIGQLRDAERLRPWLYAVCRTTALGRARRRGRLVPTEEVPAVTAVDDAADRVEREDLRRLVWEAAGGLAPQDRAVLDLHLRHGLVGAELADALEVTPHHATVRLSRVRELVERSLAVLLVGRLGRRDCPELDALLAGWDGRLEPRLRKRVARHIDACDVCEERRRAVVSPLALLASMPLVPAPAHLRDRVLTSVHRAAPGAPPPPAPPTGPKRRGRRAAALGAVAALVVLVAAGVALSGDGGAPEDVAAIGGVSTTTTEPTSTTTAAASTTASPTTSSTTTVVAAVVPARLVVLSGPQDLGAAASHAVVGLRNAGDEPLRWSGAVDISGATVGPTDGSLAPGASTELIVSVDRGALAEGSFGGSLVIIGEREADGTPAGTGRVDITGLVRRAPVVGAVATQRALIGVTGCTTTEARADVSDESSLTVSLRWIGGGATTPQTRAMAWNGARWVATLGPPTVGEDITWWVEAVDAFGLTARSADHVLDVETAAPGC